MLWSCASTLSGLCEQARTRKRSALPAVRFQRRDQKSDSEEHR